MKIADVYAHYFAIEQLIETFDDNIKFSKATGIDNLSPESFVERLEDQVGILSRKAVQGEYEFTKYKLKLISKGRGKIPREISIPTVRDRIALRALCDFLTEIYKNTIVFDLPQKIIRNVKQDFYSGNFDACIKLDVADFYPSIKHGELISRLGRKIRSKTIKNFIDSAISTPTVSVSRPSDMKSDKGVPQGLAISNILAAIYLLNIDRQLHSLVTFKYYRYVDDVLIFCALSESDEIAKQVIKKFKKIGLVVYDPKKRPDKSSIGKIEAGFDYLGYKFSERCVTARTSSVERLKLSLVSILTSHKYSKKKNKGFLLWRLNLRITGCVYENKSKGWLFFFSEIEDESLLHRMDFYVKKLLERFDVQVEPKKFVRSYYELKHRKYETNYIPNFDDYGIKEMKVVLTDYFGLDISTYNSEKIEYEFKKRLSKQVKDLQIDVMDFSYN